MGTIVGKRIRETRAKSLTGKELIYQPEKINKLREGLVLHHDIYFNWLNQEERSKVHPKWIKTALDALLEIPKSYREKEFKTRFLPSLGAVEWTLSKAEKKQVIRKVQAAEDTDLRKLSNLVPSFNGHRARTNYLEGFPHFEDNAPLCTALMEEILSTGTLMQDKAKKTPKPEYAEYLRELSQVDKSHASKKVRDIQTLLSYGRWVLQFAHDHHTSLIDELDETHAERYQSWRRTAKKGSPASNSQIKKELDYFRNLCKYAKTKKLILSNPFEDVQIKKIAAGSKKKAETSKDKPLTLSEMLDVLKFVRGVVEDPKEKREKIQQERKLNFYTIIFLCTTGCRPSEVLNYVVDEPNKLLHFNIEDTGKTKQARRSIPLTPTLTKVATDPIMALNSGNANNRTLDVSRRLHQWLKKRNGYDCNPYRFRHSVATLLLACSEVSTPEISYRMGHSSTAFTQERYGNMGVHFAKGITQEGCRKFWNWLNTKILGTPSDQYPTADTFR